MEIKNSKYISNDAKIYCEDAWNYNAPHHFNVLSNEGKILAEIDFQEGPIKEAGVNGIQNEDLILMIITRLEAFQNSDYRCDENQEAISSLREALDSLNNRRAKRIANNTEGTSQA